MRSVIARAPTRIDFGGGWTDVPPYSEEQGGFVCNLAISRYARAGIRPSRANVVIYEGGLEELTGHAEALSPDGSELAKAALRRSGLQSITLSLRSDFPPNAGLGGSSAAGVAIARAIAAWGDEDPPRAELAERSREVEVEELKIAGGRQDHYAAAFGGALGLRFSDSVAVERIELPDSLVHALERRCIVAYTGESRISGDTITAVLDAYRVREARVTTALARMRDLAREMALALERQSVDDLGGLVAEHWEHQRALHHGISTHGIERVLDVARAAGAIGGKALGASGGGCVVVIAADGSEGDVRSAVAQVAEPIRFGVDRAGVTVELEESEDRDAPAR